MNLHNLSRQVRLIIRGEMLTVQAKLAFAMRRTLFAAVALLFAGLGLVFLNIGLFALLTPQWGPVWTPIGLGLINIALAVAALAWAASMKPGPELALAEEIRNMAGEQLEAEFPLGTGFDRSAMSGLLVPAVTAIVGALARRRKEKG